MGTAARSMLRAKEPSAVPAFGIVVSSGYRRPFRMAIRSMQSFAAPRSTTTDR